MSHPKGTKASQCVCAARCHTEKGTKAATCMRLGVTHGEEPRPYFAPALTAVSLLLLLFATQHIPLFEFREVRMSPWTATSRVQFWGPQHHTELSQCVLAVGLRRVNSAAEIRCFLAASCAHRAFASSIYDGRHKVWLRLWEWRLLGWFCGLWHPQIAASELAPRMHAAKPTQPATHHKHTNAHKAQP